MTTEEKKAALIEAGVKVRSNASDETIDELWAEHDAATFAASMAGPEPVEDGKTFEEVAAEADALATEALAVEIQAEAKRVSQPVRVNSPDIMAEFHRIRQELGTNQLGDRTPAVFEWANKNLPADEWNKIYAGKRYNGEILQPKA